MSFTSSLQSLLMHRLSQLVLVRGDLKFSSLSIDLYLTRSKNPFSKLTVHHTVQVLPSPLPCIIIFPKICSPQEHEAENTAAKAKASEPSIARMPDKGEDMSDKDISKLIVVKQSRARQTDMALEARADEASVISDGLRYYERELQVILVPFLLFSSSCQFLRCTILCFETSKQGTLFGLSPFQF